MIKIDKATIYNVHIDGIDYIRFSEYEWMIYGIDEALEIEFYYEDLEKQFQKTLKIQKDIGMI